MSEINEAAAYWQKLYTDEYKLRKRIELERDSLLNECKLRGVKIDKLTETVELLQANLT